MTQRQVQLLTFLIESYIESAEPIGSRFLVEVGGFDISGATIRNELRELENLGLLTHPHTSAGRIPTESGYQLYTKELMSTPKLSAKEIQFTKQIIAEDTDTKLKQIAKETADIVNAAVIISFDGYRVYYTGMSALFSQTEFEDYAQTVKMGELFDHIEDRIPSIMEFISDTPAAYVGAEHPLGSATSIVAKKIDNNGCFMYLAPIRMQYKKAIACLDLIDTLI